MRICHVVEAAGGGSGQVVIELARHEQAAGDEVTVIHPTGPRATGQFLESLPSRPGLRLIATPMRREVGLHDAKDLWLLYRCLRNAGPFDIIHAHSSKAGALVRMVSFLFPHSVIIYTPHAFLSMAPDASPVYAWIEWLLGWMQDAIICVSEQERQHAHERLKISERKLHVIPNGVQLDYPADRPRAREKLGFGAQDYVVGFIGRLVAQKNPQRLIAAFAAAAAQHPELRLAIIGDGPLRYEAEQALAMRQLNDRAHFMVSSYARDLIPGFDCLLCSSDYESFGLVVLEAMAAGVPVVTTPVGIAEEAVMPGKTGFVTVDFTAKSLASALVHLVGLDAVARAKMSEKSKTRAQSFSLDRMAQQHAALYSELMALKTK